MGISQTLNDKKQILITGDRTLWQWFASKFRVAALLTYSASSIDPSGLYEDGRNRAPAILGHKLKELMDEPEQARAELLNQEINLPGYLATRKHAQNCQHNYQLWGPVAQGGMLKNQKALAWATYSNKGKTTNRAANSNPVESDISFVASKFFTRNPLVYLNPFALLEFASYLIPELVSRPIINGLYNMCKAGGFLRLSYVFDALLLMHDTTIRLLRYPIRALGSPMTVLVRPMVNFARNNPWQFTLLVVGSSLLVGGFIAANIFTGGGAGVAAFATGGAIVAAKVGIPLLAANILVPLASALLTAHITQKVLTHKILGIGTISGAISAVRNTIQKKLSNLFSSKPPVDDPCASDDPELDLKGGGVPSANTVNKYVEDADEVADALQSPVPQSKGKRRNSTGDVQQHSHKNSNPQSSRRSQSVGTNYQYGSK